MAQSENQSSNIAKTVLRSTEPPLLPNLCYKLPFFLSKVFRITLTPACEGESLLFCNFWSVCWLVRIVNVWTLCVRKYFQFFLRDSNLSVNLSVSVKMSAIGLVLKKVYTLWLKILIQIYTLILILNSVYICWTGWSGSGLCWGASHQE